MTMDNADHVRRVLDIALRLGEVLLASQAASTDVAESVVAVTAAYGLPDVAVTITADAIIVSVPRGVPGAPVTAMWLVTSRSLDYTRLDQATRLAQRIADDRPDLDQVEAELARLSRSGHPYPRWVATVALVVMASGLSVLLGAGALVALIAGVTTGLIDRVGRWLNSRRTPLLFQRVVGAALATTVTIGLDAAGRLPAGTAPSLVVAANLAVLLSGLAMVGTIQDAITGFHLTAVSRGVGILLSSIGLLVGVTLAVRTGVLLRVDVAVSPDIPIALPSVPTRVTAGAVAGAAAAVAGYAPLRAAVAAGIAGAAGSVLYLAAQYAHFGSVAASFLAALGIGLAGGIGAHRLRVPALVIAMAGIFPLVPGLSLYRGFVGLVTGHAADGLSNLVEAGGIGLALGGGVVLGPLLAPSIRRELRQLRPHRRRPHTQPHNPPQRLPSMAGVGSTESPNETTQPMPPIRPSNERDQPR
jgi:uncharacterized membrane protein YjjP (DUF1212 family)